jgi:transposase
VLPAAPLHLPRHPSKGREIAAKVLDSFHTCPIPEVARLGRTLRAWKAQVLAYFDTSGVSNGGTEAIHQPDQRKGPPARPRLQRF